MELELSDESTREAVWLNVADIRTAVIHSEEHRKQLWNDDTKYVKLTPSREMQDEWILSAHKSKKKG